MGLILVFYSSLATLVFVLTSVLSVSLPTTATQLSRNCVFRDMSPYRQDILQACVSDSLNKELCLLLFDISTRICVLNEQNQKKFEMIAGNQIISESNWEVCVKSWIRNLKPEYQYFNLMTLTDVEDCKTHCSNSLKTLCNVMVTALNAYSEGMKNQSFSLPSANTFVSSINSSESDKPTLTVIRKEGDQTQNPDKNGQEIKLSASDSGVAPKAPANPLVENGGLGVSANTHVENVQPTSGGSERAPANPHHENELPTSGGNPRAHANPYHENELPTSVYGTVQWELGCAEQSFQFRISDGCFPESSICYKSLENPRLYSSDVVMGVAPKASANQLVENRGLGVSANMHFENGLPTFGGNARAPANPHHENELPTSGVAPKAPANQLVENGGLGVPDKIHVENGQPTSGGNARAPANPHHENELPTSDILAGNKDSDGIDDPGNGDDDDEEEDDPHVTDEMELASDDEEEEENKTLDDETEAEQSKELDGQPGRKQPGTPEKHGQNNDGLEDHTSDKDAVQSDDSAEDTAFNKVEEVSDSSSGYFMAYFVTGLVLCVAGYFICYNKQKIFAIILEGRRNAKRRRETSGNGGSTAQYSKLEASMEEVMPSLDKEATSKNYIY